MNPRPSQGDGVALVRAEVVALGAQDLVDLVRVELQHLEGEICMETLHFML